MRSTVECFFLMFPTVYYLVQLLLLKTKGEHSALSLQLETAENKLSAAVAERQDIESEIVEKSGKIKAKWDEVHEKVS